MFSTARYSVRAVRSFQLQQQKLIRLASTTSPSLSVASSYWNGQREGGSRWSSSTAAAAVAAASSVAVGASLYGNRMTYCDAAAAAASPIPEQKPEFADDIEKEVVEQIAPPGVIKGIKNPMTVYVKHAVKREITLRRNSTSEQKEQREKEQRQNQLEQQQQKQEQKQQQQQKLQQLMKKQEEQDQQKQASNTPTQAQATSPLPPAAKPASVDPALLPIDHTLAHDKMTADEVRIEEKTRKAKQHSGGLKIFSGNGNMALALEIARSLGINLGKATVGRFADGEVNVVINENVRGKDVYVIQPTCTPVNDNLMELLLMVSTLRRASARRITVVIPYYGYARQDRKMQARVPISAADVARLMESMGVDRVIAVDLHCGQIQGFFGPRVPVDNLDGGIVGLDYFGSKDLHNPVIVSPDAGGVYRAKKFKEGLEQKYDMSDLGLAMIVKQRARAGSVDQMDLVGDVKDCDCILVDDMIDTAGTLCKAAEVLSANGARRVFAFASHGLLSGPGNERLSNSVMEEVVILNTIPSSPQREANEKLTELSVAPLLAQAIFNIHAKKSISALFK